MATALTMKKGQLHFKDKQELLSNDLEIWVEHTFLNEETDYCTVCYKSHLKLQFQEVLTFSTWGQYTHCFMDCSPSQRQSCTFPSFALKIVPDQVPVQIADEMTVMNVISSCKI